ncbi:iron ABC transporter permease [Ruegeria sp. Ofav3-42]|uniref:FecCD family ABC transporter permease n=1 Tax=Ruegeria sp. Ofav3-42 TaxID=2917759 RepID=UPI001EF42DC9|nr:iron ABC transporter permease [Ruegeria sp. Ofav3-42]MCG7521791.1 iron ABC transporter permease [Ruegeria sp. Ofav3-42]
MRLTRALDTRSVLRFEGGLDLRLGNLAAGFGLTLAILGTALWSLTSGDTAIGLSELMSGELNEEQQFALMYVRLPRLLLGVMAGWCLAISGAMLQSLTQNPLADPGLLGLSQGSMITIMILLLYLPSAPPALIPLAGLVGGLILLLVLRLLLRGSVGDGLAILLMGIALDTSLSAITALLVLYTPTEISLAVSTWLAGSLYLSSWSQVSGLLPWAALSLPILLFGAPFLRPLDLGDDRAAAIGLNPARVKPVLLLAAVVLTSMAVSAVGPIVFLGVMAPHLAQFLSAATGRARLILSGLMGGWLVLLADLIVRTGASQTTISLGLALTLLGVPLFIITLRLRALRTLFQS